MPWQECSKVDERLRFVARLLEGEKMAELCREFDISRKTGYKIFTRYQDCGLEGLTDRSRRPYRQANRLPFQVEARIVQFRKEHPTWGAPKIREKLRRLNLGISTPAISTVHAVLDRHGLVSRGRRSGRHKAQGTGLSTPTQPNDLWCADYKGEFMLADRRYCYPLTITDSVSRYLLACEALESTRERYAFSVFERTFKEFGLPRAIRSDNGAPFASTGFFGLSKLSVWWLRLGIHIERIKPGHPQQNGRHERMHLTLKKEATRPAGKNFLQQQAKFDHFLECFNQERPHQALGMRYPAELHHPSAQPYRGLRDLDYPFHDRTITVTRCGRICFSGRKINLSAVFAGQNVGIKQIAENVWLVSFMDYDLGFFDHECLRVECAPNPFEAKVLPMSPE
jgi:putative transposase